MSPWSVQEEIEFSSSHVEYILFRGCELKKIRKKKPPNVNLPEHWITNSSGAICTSLIFQSFKMESVTKQETYW